MQLREVAAQNAVAAVPSLSLVGAHVFGLTLNEVAAVIGSTFILLQIVHFVWKWVREYRKGNTP